MVHNCTPNFLHMEINRKIILSGKHIFSEKPLAITSVESSGLIELLKDYPDTIAGVNFNYRMNPLVQEIRHKIGIGELGDIRLVHGSYLQDWLLYETDYNWRIEPEVNGPSRMHGRYRLPLDGHRAACHRRYDHTGLRRSGHSIADSQETRHAGGVPAVDVSLTSRSMALRLRPIGTRSVPTRCGWASANSRTLL